ncbi:N-acetylmuramoyl-L-alanine amidase [Myxococcota bacterium]|nr:N-acetylmuramoyl-L-alanine amidase [Myxococcota bacterium]
MRSAVTVLAVLSLGALAPSATARGSGPVVRAPTEFEDLGYQRVFDTAAARSGVPSGLLAAVALQATGMDAHPEWEAIDGSHGLMGLRDGYDPRVDEAATAAGLDPDAVRDEAGPNVLAAARLLAEWAGGPEDPEDPEAWIDALSLYSGAGDDATGLAFASAVLRTWNEGAALETSGGIVNIPALGADLDGLLPSPWDGVPRSSDYGPATWSAAASCNYTANRAAEGGEVEYVIIHTVQGSYWGCISWFQNCSSSVSAHYVVSAGGDVTQMVLESDVAWHAGNWTYNTHSVGIEHEGYVDDPSAYTTALYDASAALTCDIATSHGFPIDRGHIIGHVEVPGATHTDPGGYWDWDYYMNLVSVFCGGAATGDLTGYIREDDIYTGANIVGATVSLNTGATTTTGGDGRYTFYALETGDYTVTASAPGYVTASDVKTVAAGITNWKSIALAADVGGGDDDTAPGDDDTAPGDDDTAPGDDDTAPGDDDTAPGDDDTAPGDDDSAPGDDDSAPGDDDTGEGPPPLARHDLLDGGSGSGCSSDGGAPAPGLGVLLLLPLMASRRRGRPC